MAPELATVSDVTWVTVLAFVNEIDSSGVGGGENGPMLRLVRIFLAAHYGTISKRGRTGAAGPVTSVAAGGVRRSYGLVALAATDASMGATEYGQQLLGILRMSNAYGPLTA